MTAKRYRLKVDKLEELSIVDRPAQAPARVSTVMKQLGENAIELAPILKREPRTATDPNITEENVMDIETLKKQLADALALAKAQADILALSADQRAFHDAMNPGDRPSFLAKSSAERGETIAKALAADPVVYDVGGRQVRKSQDPTGLLVETLKRADGAEALVKAQAAETAQMRLEKRADEELPNLPGTVQVRAALLKAVDALPEEVRKGVADALKAGNDAMAAAFAKRGVDHSTPAAGTPGAEMRALVQKRADAEKVSYEVALQKCLVDDERVRDLWDDHTAATSDN